MTYLDRNLIAGEEILFRTKKHHIIFFLPFVWFCLCFYFTYFMWQNPILAKLIFVPWTMAALFFSYVLLEYFTSEFAVTNKRVMMREGFFYRHTTEMRLATISQVNVEQSLLGQLLNYGIVAINAFGATDAFSLIAKPFVFQKTVHEQLDQLTR
ncbi:MAG: PH domain-containing protein [Gammaproteobacteria bacterium]|nr:PH domain-containing protein [Gammaproteobacteria bacterium]